MTEWGSPRGSMGRRGQEGTWSELVGHPGHLAQSPHAGPRQWLPCAAKRSLSPWGSQRPRAGHCEEHESPCVENDFILHMFHEVNKWGGADLASVTRYRGGCAAEGQREGSCGKSPSQPTASWDQNPSSRITDRPKAFPSHKPPRSQ